MPRLGSCPASRCAMQSHCLRFALWSARGPGSRRAPRRHSLWRHTIGAHAHEGKTMNKVHNPPEIAPPLGAYSHAIEAPAGARTLHISGQVGLLPDGRLAPGIEGQTEA